MPSSESALCSKCKKQKTDNRTGVCKACRSRKCTTCPVVFYTENTQCYDCRKRRGSYYDEPPIRGLSIPRGL